MSSLIPGFEYDIFISYRQKDNLGDRWVSEFVEALRTELESTFKEEISVYFDINPHDGLLETHDVDASLKEKLKCAVFIPIISRTYCDQNSFAWVHEFKAFIEQASIDQYGLKVKLPGGNVASRILPVQIHDLDPDDHRTLENALGGHIRGIEFIYKEPGVNKPLKSDDDEKKNLSRTKYSYQVNKVANAIREIVNGIRDPEHSEQLIVGSNSEIRVRKSKSPILKILSIIAFLAMIIVPGYFLIPGLLNPSISQEKSIAVLPFLNIMDDTENDWWSIALADEIINHLYKIKSFSKVVDINTVTVYKKTDKKNDKITGELNVKYLLRGTYKIVGDHIKVTANLVDPKENTYLWQHDYDELYSAKEVITLLADIAIKVAGELQANLTESESRNIKTIGTKNNEAYETIQRAKSEFLTGKGEVYELLGQALESSLRAIKLDSTYADAYAYASLFSLMSGGYSGAGGQKPEDIVSGTFYNVRKALSLDPDNAIAHFVIAAKYFYMDWDYIRADQEYMKVRELEPNNNYVLVTQGYIEFYTKVGKYSEAISIISEGKPEYRAFLPLILLNTGKVIESKDMAYSLYEKDKHWAELGLGEQLIFLKEYDSALIYLKKGIRKDPVAASMPRFQSYLAIAYYKTGRKDECRQIISQLLNKSKETTFGSPVFFIGRYYSSIGLNDSAFYWLEKAYQNHDIEMPWIKSDPILIDLKSDKRYWELYEKTGFKAFDEYMRTKTD